VALATTLIVIFNRRDIAYAAVIVWALVAIMDKQMPVQEVAWAASASAIVVTVGLIAVGIRYLTRSSKASA